MATVVKDRYVTRRSKNSTFFFCCKINFHFVMGLQGPQQEHEITVQLNNSLLEQQFWAIGVNKPSTFFYLNLF